MHEIKEQPTKPMLPARIKCQTLNQVDTVVTYLEEVCEYRYGYPNSGACQRRDPRNMKWIDLNHPDKLYSGTSCGSLLQRHIITPDDVEDLQRIINQHKKEKEAIMPKSLAEQVATLEKELQEVKEKLAREQEKKPSVTVGFEEPKGLLKYWAINDFGDIKGGYWAYDSIDEKRLALGNVFLTKEAALKKQRQRKTLAELHKMTNGFVSNSFDGWFEISTHSGADTDIVFTKKYYAGDIPRYRSLQEAQAAIDAVGVDRIKELMG